MGIFSRDKEKTVSQRIDAIIDATKKGKSGKKADRFLTAMELMKEKPEETVIKPVELCLDVLELILNNAKYSTDTYDDMLIKAENLYQDMFVFDEDTPDFDKLRLIFIEMFRERNVIEKGLYNLKLYSTFNDKNKYLVLCQVVGSYPNYKDAFDYIKEYGIQIREYMIDDNAYLANMIKVAERIGKDSNLEAPEKIISEEIENVHRMNGVYNIDPIEIAKVDENVRTANAVIANGEQLLDEVDARTKKMSVVSEELYKKAEQLRQREEAAIAIKLESAKDKLDDILNEYAETQKNLVVVEKDMLLKQIFAEAQSELEKYKALAKTISATTSLEIANLNRDAESVLKKVSNFVNNDGEVRRALEKAQVDEALLDKINKLTILNDSNIAAIQRHLETNPIAAPEEAETVQKVQVATQKVQVAASPVTIVEEEEEAIPPINPLLDPSIPFSERFAIVMKEKMRREQNGEHFHEMFDDVLIGIMEDANPYLIGPSGCGKTFMVKQIASLLNMQFIDIGYINEEYDILGFLTATGVYSRPNFYRCYKYGIIAFCDELDNGNSRAAVKLNSFLSNNLDSYYSFPNGENVHRHPNFRVIAAGNTEGNGADVNYNTREKIEESVQQRFVPMHIGYDNFVEKSILGKYEDWFQFVVLFRYATDRWAENSGTDAQGILTTRDTSRIKRYLDNGSFNTEKIIKYEFIQTKDAYYLGFLLDRMGEKLSSYPKAKPMFDAFKKQVEDIRKKVK